MTGKNEVNILDYIYLMARRWKLIVINLLIICTVAAVISLLLPQWYTGTAMILPPKERKDEFGFAGALAELPIPVLRLGEKGSPADVVMGILKSRSVADSMVKEFDLRKLYKTDRWEEAVRALGENTTVRRTDEGLIAVSVLDRSPVRAAQMANTYLRFLDDINRELSLDWTKERRDFVETQCDSVKAALRIAQDELQGFQRRHGIISVDAQAEATIKVAADLETEIMALNLKLQSLKTSLGEKHPEVEFTKERIRIRRSQLSSLLKEMSPGSSSLQLSRTNNPEESGHKLSTLFLPLGSVPELKTEYTRLSLDMEVQSAILKYLQEELEKKKIETRGEMSTVQVVDWATPPEMRTKPKRKTIVLISGIFGFIFSIFAILGVEYFQALQSGGEENSEKLKKILQEFKWRKRTNT